MCTNQYKPNIMSMEGPPLLRPRPRRPFELGPLSSTNTSAVPSPEPATTATFDEVSTAPPSRSRSILNLTSSTLAGVFGYTPDREEPVTPWGTGSETPLDGLRQDLGELLDGKNMDEALMRRSRERRGSMLSQSTQQNNRVRKPFKRKGMRQYWLPIVGKTLSLGVVGVAYGTVISHLHDTKELAPFQMDGIEKASPYYLAFWGLVGITLGWLMPYVDRIWNGDDEYDDVTSSEYKSSGNIKSAQDRGNRREGWAPVWNDLVRTVGAFCGIAFAIVSNYSFSTHAACQSTDVHLGSDKN